MIRIGNALFLLEESWLVLLLEQTSGQKSICHVQQSLRRYAMQSISIFSWKILPQQKFAASELLQKTTRRERGRECEGLHFVSTTSCLFMLHCCLSCVICGHWARWTEHQQEVTLTQCNPSLSNLLEEEKEAWRQQ